MFRNPISSSMHEFALLSDVCLGMGNGLMVLMENGWMVVGIVSIIGSYYAGEMCVKGE